MMKKKYIVMGIIAVFLLGAYVMDAIRANSYEYELVDTSPRHLLLTGNLLFGLR